VEGQDDPHGAKWAVLGTTTLYDLSGEKLGRNFTLKIPLTTYKYLRVIVDKPVNPSDVESGTAGITRAQKAIWRDLGSEPKQSQQGKDTILTFSLPGEVPVERAVISVDPAQQNFLRKVEVQGENGQEFGVAGSSRKYRGCSENNNSQRGRHAVENHGRATSTVRAPDLLRC
jgi:hypothetical protein